MPVLCSAGANLANYALAAITTEIHLVGLRRSLASFNALMENAKEVLSHYVNRRGDRVPSQLKTRGQLSLWLMEKDDGTMMGLKKQSLWQRVRNRLVR